MDGYRPDTYGEAFADVYDEWYGDAAVAGDPAAAVATLAELAGTGPVLELGVGTGRIAVPLAERGVETWGLDASEAMLDRLRARPGGERVQAVHGDMADPRRALPAERPQFAVVTAAFNTLFLLPTASAQQSCLGGAASLLRPGGVVVVECFVPAEPVEGVEQVLEPRRIGVDYVVLTVSDHRPTEQLVVGQHLEIRESGIRLRPWVLRYSSPVQLDELAEQAGLHLRARWGGWDRRPFGDASGVHVSVYAAG